MNDDNNKSSFRPAPREPTPTKTFYGRMTTTTTKTPVGYMNTKNFHLVVPHDNKIVIFDEDHWRIVDMKRGRNGKGRITKIIIAVRLDTWDFEDDTNEEAIWTFKPNHIWFYNQPQLTAWCRANEDKFPLSCYETLPHNRIHELMYDYNNSENGNLLREEKGAEGLLALDDDSERGDWYKEYDSQREGQQYPEVFFYEDGPQQIEDIDDFEQELTKYGDPSYVEKDSDRDGSLENNEDDDDDDDDEDDSDYKMSPEELHEANRNKRKHD